jgi:hypothetical protein
MRLASNQDVQLVAPSASTEPSSNSEGRATHRTKRIDRAVIQLGRTCNSPRRAHRPSRHPGRASACNPSRRAHRPTHHQTRKDAQLAAPSASTEPSSNSGVGRSGRTTAKLLPASLPADSTGRMLPAAHADARRCKAVRTSALARPSSQIHATGRRSSRRRKPRPASSLFRRSRRRDGPRRGCGGG